MGADDGFRPLERGTGDARRAADGDRDALARLGASAWAFATRMCRAELGSVLGTGTADAVAGGLLPGAMAAVVASPARSPLRVVYTETVSGIEAVRPVAVPAGPLDELPRHERDVMVLRTVVGLSTGQSAEALACSADRVRIDQHSALQVLRGVAVRR